MQRIIGTVFVLVAILAYALENFGITKIFNDAASRLLAVAAFLLAGVAVFFIQTPARPPLATQPRIGIKIARAGAIASGVIALLITLFILAHDPPTATRGDLLSLLFVATFAGGVGYAELTQRYRDDPARLLAADPTIIYVCVNIAAAIGALALVREFGVFAGKPHQAWYEVLLASFGSIAFFRSSLFTARVGDKDIDIGPSTLLKSLLNTSDMMINRSQARDRTDDTAQIMQLVSFARAKAALPALCFTVVESITQEDQDRIGRDIVKLAAAQDMDDRQRSVILGTYLMRVVGPQVLARAVTALGDSILAATPPPGAPPPEKPAPKM